MYLGYLEMKDTIYYNPGGIFWNKEVLVNADFTLLSRHFYVDLLLGYEDCVDDLFAYVHPMDLYQLEDLDKQLMVHGCSEYVFRMLCNSNSSDKVKWLIVLTKMYPFHTQSGDMILVTYSWPFAFANSDCDSVMQSKSIVDHLEFIKSNEAWLSLMPSFVEGTVHWTFYWRISTSLVRVFEFTWFMYPCPEYFGECCCVSHEELTWLT